VGGQWPGPVYITGQVLVYGQNSPPVVVVRNSGEWNFLGLPNSPGSVSFYSSYHSLADGRVLAVRVERTEENAWADPDKKGHIGAVRDKADLMEKNKRSQQNAGPEGVELAGGDRGAVVVRPEPLALPRCDSRPLFDADDRLVDGRPHAQGTRPGCSEGGPGPSLPR